MGEVVLLKEKYTEIELLDGLLGGGVCCSSLIVDVLRIVLSYQALDDI